MSDRYQAPLPHQADTIAAIATALGEGGISVIRISGPKAAEVVARGFRGKHSLEGAATHTAHYGSFTDRDGKEIDEVVVTLFREPHSYTGETVVELSCHGGPFVTRRILGALVEAGARHADPGEFTKRAFLHGKLDLAQAEAVADLIRSQSDLAHRASFEQLQGKLSSEIRLLRDALIQIIGLLEVELDFVEEGLEFVDRQKLTNLLQEAISKTGRLASTFTTGKIIRDGIRVVLAGAPNVGKSSILNSLLAEERAIVTDIPGTTRDVIEEGIIVDGLAVRLIDTAGVRTAESIVEAEGVRRSERQIENCDVLLLVLDSSRHLEEIDLAHSNRLLTSLKRPEAPCILVLNKSDLTSRLTSRELVDIEAFAGLKRITVSAVNGHGLENLRLALVDAVGMRKGWSGEGGALVTHRRHHDALRRAQGELSRAMDSLVAGASNDFLSVDIRAALDSLGEIVGAVTTDDILEDIFSKFCIGK
ncbi:MAG: tRNA uridine-5-carboxymethylaminomethyl(34) synthesis GTPase MnmE [Ignavibacteria bacterium]|nr:tRNA uridine-5-carboxymethylaminomethyl(34) synthesis GTPase MnmE [Ignavibacteria bacterium]